MHAYTHTHIHIYIYTYKNLNKRHSLLTESGWQLIEQQQQCHVFHCDSFIFYYQIYFAC